MHACCESGRQLRYAHILVWSDADLHHWSEVHRKPGLGANVGAMYVVGSSPLGNVSHI
jgi:hypothetical protein